MQYKYARRLQMVGCFCEGDEAGCLETHSKTGHAVHNPKPQSQTNVLFKDPKRCLLHSA